jgi:hypothetical protein
MSDSTITAKPTDVSKHIGQLRATALAAIVMLLVEFAIGSNLYNTVPKAAHGEPIFAAFGIAIAQGPIALGIHAVIGTLIIAGAIQALVRAIQTRKVGYLVLSIIALVAIVLAWFGGSTYVSTQSAIASHIMGLGTGVALLCYAIVLFILPKRP